MKKLLFLNLLAATCIAGLAQDKTLVQSLLLKPKAGMVYQFEDAMKTHNKKFHTGLNKVFVFQIISGAKMGYYQIAWPPGSWTDMDNVKPDPAHDLDVQATIASKIEVNEGFAFATRVDSLSHGDHDWTIAKSRITIWHVKRGKMEDLAAWGRKIKLVYDNTNDKRNYTIYTSLLTGTDPLVLRVNRYKNGWKEMEPGFHPSLKDLFIKAYSAAEWEAYLKAFGECVEKEETYLRVFRPDLSTK